jgi:hypothetical protein
MKSIKFDPCIYCGSTQNLCRQSHVVSRSLSTFKNQPSLHYKVCRTCEEEFGKCEEVLAKCGPEALFIANLGIKGRHKNSTSPFERKHAGHRPIKMKSKIPGFDDEFLFKPKGDGGNAEFLNQILIKDSTGQQHQIPVPNIDNLNTEKLQQLIKAENIRNPISEVAAIGESNETTNHIFSLLKQIFKGDEKTEIINPFRGIIKGSGRLTYDDRYFRGIAKMAFHYYLAFNEIGHMGSELVFKPIRDFIRYSKGKRENFISEYKGYFVKNPETALTFAHIFYSETTSKSIITLEQLFVGPEYNPPYYKIIISKNPFLIEIPRQVFGHNYSYLPFDQKKQYDGTIHKLAIANQIRTP